ncbi:hypothetical protein Fot_32676 [Forsythia ovata]|uniref:Uncharacterized protein n=1 Tax=Forsythia ovata TaxID=205694 RepID=A0ABD1T8I3_9LAMI
MVEAESQIAILTKKLDDALNAQNIASEALETANGENRQLTAEAFAKQEDVLKIKVDLDEALKGKAEVEAQKEELAKNVRQHAVITTLRSECPDLDLSSLEAKFPSMDIEDPHEE